jgi:hypothetical protein
MIDPTRTDYKELIEFIFGVTDQRRYKPSFSRELILSFFEAELLTTKQCSELIKDFNVA